MPLTSSEITAVKAHIDGIYSLAQIAKWTNPDVKFSGSVPARDETIYTNMINSAYSYYLMYFSPNFSSANETALTVLARTVIYVMENWRTDGAEEKIEQFLVKLKRNILRTQWSRVVKVDLSENPRNIDSSDVAYQGEDFDGKI